MCWVCLLLRLMGSILGRNFCLAPLLFLLLLLLLLLLAGRRVRRP